MLLQEAFASPQGTMITRPIFYGLIFWAALVGCETQEASQPKEIPLDWRERAKSALEPPFQPVSETSAHPNKLVVGLHLSIVARALFDDELRAETIHYLTVKGYYDDSHTVMARMSGPRGARFFFYDRIYVDQLSLLEAISATKYSMQIYYLPTLGAVDPIEDLELMLQSERDVIKFDGVRKYKIAQIPPAVPH